MKRLTVLAIVLLSSSVTACGLLGKDGAPGPAGPPGPAAADANGSSTSGGPAASSSGAPGAASSTSSSSSSSSGASTSSSSGGTTPAAPTKTGSVTINQTSITAGDNEFDSYVAMAVFTDTTGAAVVPPADTAKCTQSTEGDCAVTVCDATGVVGGNGGNNDEPPPAPVKSPTASDITISATDDITISPNDKGNYSPKTGQTLLYNAGDTITVTAKGAEVPAFNTTVTGPAIVTINTPDWPAAGKALNIDHTADLALAWDNGGDGDVTVQISSAADKKTSLIQCTFKSGDGTGTITAAALGKLIVGNSGTISINSGSTALVDQGGWKINVSAQSPATTAAGTPAAGIAHIQ